MSHKKSMKREEKDLDLDLFRDCDQASISSAMTQDPNGRASPHVRRKPSPKDPTLTHALTKSIAVQLYKMFSGLSGMCCNGMDGDFATKMMNEKQ